MALKIIRVPVDDNGMPGWLIREISLLRHLGKFEHPNIVALLEICFESKKQTGSEITLVMDYVEMDLAKYIATIKLDTTPLPPAVLKVNVNNQLWTVTYFMQIY